MIYKDKVLSQHKANSSCTGWATRREQTGSSMDQGDWISCSAAGSEARSTSIKRRSLAG